MNIFFEIEAHLQSRKTQVALRNFRTGNAYSGQQLLDLVDNLSRSLENHLPKEKCVVALSLANSEISLASVLAIWKLGHIAMPLPHSVPHAELKHILQRGPASALLLKSGPLTAESIPLTIGRLRLALFPKTSEFLFPTEDLAFIRFTSGTTDTARGVLISHSAIFHRAQSFANALELKPGKSVFWHLDMAYHFTTSISAFLLSGCEIHLGHSLLPLQFSNWIEQQSVNYFFSLPYFFESLNRLTQPLLLKNETQLFVTGLSLQESVWKDFLKLHGQPIHRMYGVIEIGIPVLGASGEDVQVLGRLVHPYEVKLIDGVINLRGPGTFCGYLSGPNFHFQSFDQDWFNTGDLGEWTNEGELAFRGRTKELLLLGQFKMFPFEIENFLNQFPGVRASCAYIEGTSLAASYEADTEICPEDLKDHLRQHLELGKIPEVFHHVVSIPRTPSGKILRRRESSSYE